MIAIQGEVKGAVIVVLGYVLEELLKQQHNKIWYFNKFKLFL